MILNIAFKLPLLLVSLMVFFLLFVNCERMVEDWEVKNLTKDFVLWYTQFFPDKLRTHVNSKIDELDFHNFEQINRQLKKFALRLSLVDTSAISFESRVDYFILRKKINYLLFELNDWCRWQHDAAYYVEKLVAMFQLNQSQYIAHSQSAMKQLLANARDLPIYLAHASANLQYHQISNINAALGEIDLLKLLMNENFVRATEINTNFADSLNSFYSATIDSLDSFAVDLTRTKNDSAPSLGRGQYERLLRILLDDEVKLNELINQVESDYHSVVAEMANLAKQYLKIQNVPMGIRDKEEICQVLIDELSKDVPRKDQIFAWCTEIENYHKIFIDEIALFKLPIDYSINVSWGNATTFPANKLLSLAPVDLSAVGSNYQLFLKPISTDIEWIAQLSALREFSRSHLKAAMLLDGFPIHFHYWHRHGAKISLATKVFPDNSYLSGFKMNFAKTLLEKGLGGYDQALQFVLLENLAQADFKALIELKYFDNQFAPRQVDSLFADSGIFRQQPVDIIRQMNTNPGQLVEEYWGINKFNQLKIRCKKNQGREFRENSFYLSALKYGPIPLSLLAERIFRSSKQHN